MSATYGPGPAAYAISRWPHSKGVALPGQPRSPTLSGEGLSAPVINTLAEWNLANPASAESGSIEGWLRTSVPHGRRRFEIMSKSFRGAPPTKTRGCVSTTFVSQSVHNPRSPAGRKWRSEQLLLVKAMFLKHDADRSGSLDRKEVAAMCHDLGSPLDAEQLHVALGELDKNGDGVIDLTEVLGWWIESHRKLVEDVFNAA